jgi:hypothetical protein
MVRHCRSIFSDAKLGDEIKELRRELLAVTA